MVQRGGRVLPAGLQEAVLCHSCVNTAGWWLALSYCFILHSFAKTFFRHRNFNTFYSEFSRISIKRKPCWCYTRLWAWWRARQQLLQGCRRFRQSRLGEERGTAGSLSWTGDGSLPPALCIDRRGPADLAGRKEKSRGFASAYAVYLALGRTRVNSSQRVWGWKELGYAPQGCRGPARTWQSSGAPLADLGAYGKCADIPVVIVVLASRQIGRYAYSISAEIY